jgi:hypothetical protein
MAKAGDDQKKQEAALAKLKDELKKVCKANETAGKKAKDLLKEIKSKPA